MPGLGVAGADHIESRPNNLTHQNTCTTLCVGWVLDVEVWEP